MDRPQEHARSQGWAALEILGVGYRRMGKKGHCGPEEELRNPTPNDTMSVKIIRFSAPVNAREVIAQTRCEAALEALSDAAPHSGLQTTNKERPLI